MQRAVVGAGEAGAVFEIVVGGALGHFGSFIRGIATALGLEGFEELANGIDGLGDGAGGVEGWGGKVAVGADEVLVVAGEAADGFFGGFGWIGRRESGETGEGESGNAQGGEGDAGTGGIELMGEDAVQDLGGHELDGGAVLEEGDGDVARLGEGGAAVAVVGVAEVEVAEDLVFAAVAVDGQGAALGAAGRDGVAEEGIEFVAGKGDGFEKRLVGHGGILSF